MRGTSSLVVWSPNFVSMAEMTGVEITRKFRDVDFNRLIFLIRVKLRKI